MRQGLTPAEEYRALCLPWFEDTDGMLCGKGMEVISGLCEDENGQPGPAVYRDEMRQFIILACNTHHARTLRLRRVEKAVYAAISYICSGCAQGDCSSCAHGSAVAKIRETAYGDILDLAPAYEAETCAEIDAPKARTDGKGELVGLIRRKFEHKACDNCMEPHLHSPHPDSVSACRACKRGDWGGSEDKWQAKV